MTRGCYKMTTKIKDEILIFTTNFQFLPLSLVASILSLIAWNRSPLALALLLTSTLGGVSLSILMNAYYGCSGTYDIIPEKFNVMGSGTYICFFLGTVWLGIILLPWPVNVIFYAGGGYVAWKSILFLWGP